jgi:2',3'-cyclic-nucleotide 2'-phosphodiesterase (5'-nucleotidase family)
VNFYLVSNEIDWTQQCLQPWLLSNVIDNRTSQVPKHLHEFQILERANVRVGIIGLIEKYVKMAHDEGSDNLSYIYQGMDRNYPVVALKF